MSSKIKRPKPRRAAAFIHQVDRAHAEAVEIAHNTARVEAEVAFRETYGRRFAELFSEFFESAVDQAGAQ